MNIYYVHFMTRDHKQHLESVIVESTREAETYILDNYDVDVLYGTIHYGSYDWDENREEQTS